MKKFGIFGGSFNPVHTGHMIAAQLTAEAAGLDEVLFIPAGRPPHKAHNSLVDACHRLKMLERATAGNPIFSVSDIEIKRDGPSYTLTTVLEIKKNLSEPDSRLALILGADSIRDFHTWHRAGELLENVEVIGLRRPNVNDYDLKENRKILGARKAEKLENCFITLPLIEISSSDIRLRRQQGRTIRYLVPDTVREYILKNDLYR